MSKEQTKDLLTFLKPFPKDVQEIALWLRGFVWDMYPKANEMIYDNYNALAFGWSPTDKMSQVFCSIAVGRSSYNVHFGFYWGSKITDPKKILLGEGNQYRYILVKNIKEFPQAYMKKLVKEAYAYSCSLVKPVIKGGVVIKPPEGTTVTRSIVPVKRKLAKRLAKKK